MAEHYSMDMGGIPMISTVMPNPIGITQNLTQISTTRDMTLPMSSAMPINVTENTPNLEQIQSFPVTMRNPNGIHFHQDPVTGQMYRMTSEFHSRISDIVSNKKSTDGNNLNNSQMTSAEQLQEFVEISSVNRRLDANSIFTAMVENTISDNIEPFSQTISTVAQTVYTPSRNPDYSQESFFENFNINRLNYTNGQIFDNSSQNNTYTQKNIIYVTDENSNRRPANKLSGLFNVSSTNQFINNESDKKSMNTISTLVESVQPVTPISSELPSRPMNTIKRIQSSVEIKESISNSDFLKKPMNRIGSF